MLVWLFARKPRDQKVVKFVLGAMESAESATVKVSILSADGSCTEIDVEPGTTISKLTDREGFRLQGGYCSRFWIAIKELDVSYRMDI